MLIPLVFSSLHTSRKKRISSFPQGHFLFDVDFGIRFDVRPVLHPDGKLLHVHNAVTRNRFAHRMVAHKNNCPPWLPTKRIPQSQNQTESWIDQGESRADQDERHRHERNQCGATSHLVWLTCHLCHTMLCYTIWLHQIYGESRRIDPQ